MSEYKKTGIFNGNLKDFVMSNYTKFRKIFGVEDIIEKYGIRIDSSKIFLTHFLNGATKKLSYNLRVLIRGPSKEIRKITQTLISKLGIELKDE